MNSQSKGGVTPQWPHTTACSLLEATKVITSIQLPQLKICKQSLAKICCRTTALNSEYGLLKMKLSLKLTAIVLDNFSLLESHLATHKGVSLES